MSKFVLGDGRTHIASPLMQERLQRPSVTESAGEGVGSIIDQG